MIPKMKQLRRIGKKGVLENLSVLAVSAAGMAITVIVVFLILSNLSTNATVTADANASNTVTVVQDALDDNVVGFVGLIILVAVAGLLIFLVRRGLR